MKNNAIPVVERHLYDIDAFDILDQMRTKYGNSDDVLEKVQIIEQMLTNEANAEQISLEESSKVRNFIVPSTFSNYGTFLTLKLLLIDPYKIQLLLTYQCGLFEGNRYARKDNFIGLIEFFVYAQTRSFIKISEPIRLEKISEWLQSKRESLQQIAAIPVVSTKEFSTVVFFDQNKEGLFCERMKMYISSEQFENFKKLISGNELDGKILFMGQVNQLVDLFKRLKKHNFINVYSYPKLGKWLLDNFLYLNRRNEETALEINTLNSLLKKSKPVSKRNRIIPEFAPFLDKN